MRTAKSANVEIKRSFDYELFKGVSIQLGEQSPDAIETTISQIASQDNVKQVWPVRWNPVPNDTVIWAGGSESLPNHMVKKRQNHNASDSFPPHVATQVDLLHAKGITGKGVKIAVVDTGIDWKVSLRSDLDNSRS